MKGELIIQCNNVYRSDNYVICLFLQNIPSADSNNGASSRDLPSVTRPEKQWVYIVINISGLCKVNSWVWNQNCNVTKVICQQ